MLRITACISVVLLVLSYPVRADDLSKLSGSHAASLAAIRTLHAKVDYTLGDGTPLAPLPTNLGPNETISHPKPKQSALFTKRGALVRIEELISDFGRRTLQYDLAKGETRVFPVIPAGEPKVGYMIVDPLRVDTYFDIWSECLGLREASEDVRERGVTFDRVAKDSRYKSFKVLGPDPTTSSAIQVTFQFAGSGRPVNYAVWLDPAVNHLIRRVVRTVESPQGVLAYEMAVEQFGEPKAGIFIPTTVVFHSKVGKVAFPKVTLTLTDLRVNESLPPATFRSEFPPGVRVTDSVRGTTYTVAADGGQKNPGVIAPAPSLPPGQPQPTATPPDADEPAWPWWKRIVLASAMVVLVAGVVTWVRRRKPRG